MQELVTELNKRVELLTKQRDAYKSKLEGCQKKCNYFIQHAYSLLNTNKQLRENIKRLKCRDGSN